MRQHRTATVVPKWLANYVSCQTCLFHTANDWTVRRYVLYILSEINATCVMVNPISRFSWHLTLIFDIDCYFSISIQDPVCEMESSRSKPRECGRSPVARTQQTALRWQCTGLIKSSITGSEVALHCCKAHAKMNRKMGNSTPIKSYRSKYHLEILHTWLRRPDYPPCKVWFQWVLWGLLAK